MSWVGVDLDGTLAVYDKWRGIDHIGEPIWPVVKYVMSLIEAGVEVRIVTARVQEGPAAVHVIEQWWYKHIADFLVPITDKKDFGMIFLIDDRAVTVEKNTGKFLVEPPALQEITWHHSPQNPENPAYVGPVAQADGDNG